jgi:eukaryotic-like serine/threonine-protein kinase
MHLIRGENKNRNGAAQANGLRARQRLGKYRIEKALGEGGYAKVYQALDTIEGVRVALKLPNQRWMSTPAVMEDFRKEVRLTARLSHPHILPIKNAEFIEGQFVIAYPLGEETLCDRMHRRLSQSTGIEFSEQMISAVAFAHENRIIHCDVKPENFILFPDNLLRLTDFGIAKIAFQTLRASGSGTVGYVAPEQAMGKPSFRSDVFSLGLILYRMFSGALPEWPYEWPPPGIQRLRAKLHPDLIEVVRRAMMVDPRKRYRDGEQLLAAFVRVRGRALKHARRRQTAGGTLRDWRTVRRRQFLREFGSTLDTRHQCQHCAGPVSEAMLACPWCGRSRAVLPEETQFSCHCARCNRGMKLDWKFCAWCYGGSYELQTTRQLSDVRYEARCGNPRCRRKDLMSFMRYCPWCNRKVRRKWQIPGNEQRCRNCGWGVLGAYWSFCPWCSKQVNGQ